MLGEMGLLYYHRMFHEPVSGIRKDSLSKDTYLQKAIILEGYFKCMRVLNNVTRRSDFSGSGKGDCKRGLIYDMKTKTLFDIIDNNTSVTVKE